MIDGGNGGSVGNFGRELHGLFKVCVARYYCHRGRQAVTGVKVGDLGDLGPVMAGTSGVCGASK